MSDLNTVTPQNTSGGDGKNTETEQGKSTTTVNVGTGAANPAGAGAAQQPERREESPEARPIFTQADLDQIVNTRLAREKEKQEKELAKAKSDAEREALKQKGEYETLYKQEQDRANDLERQIELARIRDIRTRAVSTHQLPLEFTDRLLGTSEEEIFHDAEKVKRMLGVRQAPVAEGGDRRENITDEQRRQANEAPVIKSHRYNSM